LGSAISAPPGLLGSAISAPPEAGGFFISFPLLPFEPLSLFGDLLEFSSFELELFPLCSLFDVYELFLNHFFVGLFNYI
ncbi:hypothetical protein, partial [Mycoplasmopsis pulmonis]|uniref:hypothetical protein n=1 Tax=Mycoplasmopsis pulmonis TaxID=2107 RepID=UPI002ACD88B2